MAKIVTKFINASKDAIKTLKKYMGNGFCLMAAFLSISALLYAIVAYGSFELAVSAADDHKIALMVASFLSGIFVSATGFSFTSMIVPEPVVTKIASLTGTSVAVIDGIARLIVISMFSSIISFLLFISACACCLIALFFVRHIRPAIGAFSGITGVIVGALALNTGIPLGVFFGWIYVILSAAILLISAVLPHIRKMRKKEHGVIDIDQAAPYSVE